MSDPSLELQAGALVAVRASPALVAMFGSADDIPAFDTGPPVLDDGDGEVGYPFIRVGDYDVATEGEPIMHNGVTVDDPSDVTLTVHVFARGPDRNVTAKQIAAALRKALSAEFPLENGFKITLGQSESVRHFTESDGLTAHAVLAFRYYVESSEA